ncbi:hypothetical protein DH2020_016723 [Rehmannia glutinosa]|uniref:Integrase catalytic domain-containing protein n=1 Tax=Rehmannia glutinosa TaxID=99300 RepID=A0ABR0WNT3_REHGL
MGAEIMEIREWDDWRVDIYRCLGTTDLPEDEKNVTSSAKGHKIPFDQGTDALAKKVVRDGYFWPNYKKDVEDLVKRCGKCQKHSSLIHQPVELLGVMSSPCPFAKGGIDIVAPFSIAVKQRKFLIVVVDYFSKWVEAEPVAKITESQVMSFIRKNLASRFKWPRDLISDNETQFHGRKIREWLAEMKVKQH